MSLTPETILVRCREPLTAPVDDELVMLDPRRGVYFGLDPTGHRIWELLERPRSVRELCKVLEGEFDVTAEGCQAEVLKFLEQMSTAELVEIR